METTSEKDIVNNNKTLVNSAKKSVNEPKLQNNENDAGTVLITVPPDGGWGWVVVVASFVANFIVDGILYCYGDFIPFFREEFNEPIAKLTIPGSLLAGFYLMTGPFVSILTNKFGFQKVVVIGSIFAALFFAASSLAMNVEFLILSYGILGGIGFGMIYSPSIVIVGYYFEKWRGIATGIAVCGSGIGTFAISPLNTFLLEKVKWKNTYLIQAGIILICAICGLMFRPIKPVRVAIDENIDDEDVKPEEPLKKSITEDIQRLKNNKPPTAAEILSIQMNDKTTGTKLSKSSQSFYIDDCLHKHENNANKKRKRLSVPNLEENTNSPPIKKKLRSMSQGALKTKKSVVNGVSLSPYQSVECMIKNRRGTITKVDEPVEVPLQRDDAFFAGSLQRLSQYKAEDSISYTLTVTRVPLEDKKKPFWKVILDLFDFSLLLSPSFDLLLLSGLLTMLGYFTPFNYVKDRAEESGFDKNEISWLLSTIGITNTVGRIVSGFISTLPGMDATFINNLALIIAGIATMVSGLVMTVPYQYAYCAIFGLSTSAFASLRSIMVVDLLGLENLNNAFGILLFVQGFGSALGAPVAGAIKDATGDYDISFYFSGTLIMLSGLVLVPVKAINRWEKRRKNKLSI